MKDVCWALGPGGCLRPVIIISEMMGGKKLCFFNYQIAYFSWAVLKDKSPIASIIIEITKPDQICECSKAQGETNL